jgi:hypothetical protein
VRKVSNLQKVYASKTQVNIHANQNNQIYGYPDLRQYDVRRQDFRQWGGVQLILSSSNSLPDIRQLPRVHMTFTSTPPEHSPIIGESHTVEVPIPQL